MAEKQPRRPKKAAKRGSAVARAADSVSRTLRTRRVRRHLTNEFKPDAPQVSALKPLRFTKLQRLQVLRVLLYYLTGGLSIVVQDALLSRVTILHATFDLPAALLLTLCVLEGSSRGSVMVIIGSCLYYFSGSAPFPYCVGLLSVIGIMASVLRERYLHRSDGSIMICSAAAAILYEIGLYIIGLFLGLTYWIRLPVFLLTGILTALAVWPVHAVLYRIGLIGGITWKE